MCENHTNLRANNRDRFDLDAIATLIRVLGVKATVGDSGSGIFGIFVGDVLDDADGTPRYTVVAGPGRSVWDGGALAHRTLGDVGKFSFSQDSIIGEGNGYPVKAGETPAVTARRIVNLHNLVMTRRAERDAMFDADRIDMLTTDSLAAFWGALRTSLAAMSPYVITDDGEKEADEEALQQAAEAVIRQFIAGNFSQDVEMDEKPAEPGVPETKVYDMPYEESQTAVEGKLNLTCDQQAWAGTFTKVVRETFVDVLNDGWGGESDGGSAVDAVFYTVDDGRGNIKGVTGNVVAVEEGGVKFADGFYLAFEDIMTVRI